MSKAEREKGKRGEREAAKLLRDMGFAEARRTAQFCGKTGDASDVVGIPGYHVEVKRCERLELPKWIRQAERDAAAKGPGVIPIVMHRRSGEPWYITIPAIDFLQAIKK